MFVTLQVWLLVKRRAFSIFLYLATVSNNTVLAPLKTPHHKQIKVPDFSPKLSNSCLVTNL